MQLKLIDVRAYSTNDGAATPPNPAIILSASNANISPIGCDFEGGKSSFLYSNQVIRQISIIDSYIEGFGGNPLSFDADVSAFVFEGNWLGYNAAQQEWRNIKSGRISGNVFAKQQTYIGHNNGNLSLGNNTFIDGSNAFFFNSLGAAVTSGVTALDIPGWLVDANGFLHLSGKLSRVISGDLFTLPVGARPRLNFKRL